MKTAKLGFIQFYFFLTTLLSAQWSWSSIPCPGGIPNCLYMDRKTEDVYVGCYGGVWKLNQTTNQWSLVDNGIQDSTIFANAKITSLYLDKSGVFYAGCDSNTPSYISYNSGKTWQQIQDINFTLRQINCIAEYPSGSIFLGTNGGKVLRTMDRGKSWAKLNNSPAYVNDIIVDLAGVLWAASTDGIYKSIDNGETWLKKSSGMLAVTMTSIELDSKGIFWVGADGDVYRSDNYGENWISKRRIQMGGHIFDLTIDKEDVVFIACYSMTGYINYTIDNGNTWIEFPWVRNYGTPQQLIVNSKGEIYSRQLNRDLTKWVNNPSSVQQNKIYFPGFDLSQNYPNPFNPTTTIKYSIPSVGAEHVQPLHVLLKVYDLLGREVATLVNEEKPPGNYEVTFSVETRRGESLPTGVYFYRLTAGSYSETKKMVLIK